MNIDDKDIKGIQALAMVNEAIGLISQTFGELDQFEKKLKEWRAANEIRLDEMLRAKAILETARRI